MIVFLYPFLINIMIYCYLSKTIFFGKNQNTLSLQNGSEINPFSSLDYFFEKIIDYSNENQIDLIYKDNFFNNILSEKKYEISRLNLKIS